MQKIAYNSFVTVLSFYLILSPAPAMSLRFFYLEIFSVNYYYHEFTARQCNYFGFMCELKVFE